MTIGIIPTADAFLPTDTNTQIAVLAGTVSSLLLLDYVATPAVAVAGTAALLAAGWIHHRWETRATRHGYVLDEPYTFVDSSVAEKPEGNANWEVTAITQKAGFPAIVTETRSHQYRILQIENDNPNAVEKLLPAISMKLGIHEANLKFEQNYKLGVSAILAPLPKSAWEAVTLNADALQPGHLIGYVGRAINGEDITYDRRIEPHLLIAGDTNSGKTEALRVDMQSMRLSGLNPEIYIIDPKEDMEGECCAFYTSDLHQGVAKLESLAAQADARKAKYNKAGCKNYFEYQERVDSSERPLMVYIDETADLLTKDLLEKLEKDEYPLHERALSILYYISRKNRAGGLFLTLGIQHPKADTMPTNIRNNLGARLVLSMADSTASKVALGSTGAETLPKFGGFMFKTSLHTPIIGRGAYIPNNQTQ
jgi:hypothetical protein